MKTTLLLTLLLAATAFAQPKFGWKPSPHGIKATPLTFRAEPLPDSASLQSHFAASDQGDRGACVAFTAVESYSAVHSVIFGRPMDLSELDVYQQCLVKDGNFPNDEGTYGMTAISVLLNSGAMTEALWPYSRPLDVLPALTPAMKGSRTKHRAIKAYAISNTDGGYAAMQCIAKLKIPVMAGIWWPSSWMSPKKVTVTTKAPDGKAIREERWILPPPSGSNVGGHEVPFGAYDKNMVFPDGSVGGVWLHNHWSPKAQPWGDSIGGAWIRMKDAFNPRRVEDLCAIEIVKK